MRSIETDGDSIDLAIEKALQTLQIGRDQVEVEILADATKGLFGFGGKKARVRATVRPPLTARLQSTEVGAASNDSRATTAPRTSSPGTDSQGTRAATSPPTRTGRDADAVAAATASDAFVGRCRAVLEELINHLGISCSVTARPGEDGSVLLDVSGDAQGLLIGRRGQTLDAIEYIVNRIAARDDEPAAGRIVIDVERYRERRRDHLTTLAERLAGKVRQTGRPVTLNPMSPRDRRIVHLALQEDASVATRSQGEGHFRKILIVPADRSRKVVRQPRPAG
jgi:spoIIIJ-associated protein